MMDIAQKASATRDGWGSVFRELIPVSLEAEVLSPCEAKRSAGVALCVTTMNRTAQLRAMMCVNLCLTWRHRLSVTWIAIDVNSDYSVERFMLEELTGPLLAKHVRYTKSHEPWDNFIFPVAKNTASAMAQALVSDGWAFEDIFRINIDGDNILTRRDS